MSSNPKRTIQPRPTKASMLRLQKQQGSGLVTAQEAPTKKPETHVSTATSSRSKSTVGATEGVKAFMAQQRARLAKSNTVEQEPKKRQNNFMTGAERYGGKTDRDEASQTNTRKIQVVIKQAKSSGKLNISSRGLTKIPEEVLNMYHVDPNSIVVDFSSSGDAWYDSVELTHLIAGDNALTDMDERIGAEFGALKQIDFRDNKLKALPDSLQNLQNLTSVLLPYNQFETVPAILSELKQLRELNLSHNQIKGDVRIESSTLEQLDLGYNEIRGFDMPRNTSLIKLNLSHNQLEELPLSFRSWSKLQDLNVNQNRLVSLFPAIRDSTSTVTLASLVRLDAGNNYITSMVEGNQGQVLMPKLIELSLMTNKLDDSGLEGLKDTPYLQTLDISSNQLKNIPLLLTDLEQLERLDIRGNQLHTLPYELGKLTRLKAIQCEGNPMRSFTSMSQTQLIESLRGSYAQQESEEQGEAVKKEQDMDITVEELSRQLTQKVNLSERLDLSHKELTNIPSEYLEFKQEVPGTLLLNHNQFITFPIIPLTKISDFIVTLVLDHNRLTSFNLSLEGVVFAHLKTLKLNNNRIKSLECNPNTASFPRLEELSLNYNALTTLSDDLPKVLPSLKILLASSNKLDNLTDACFGQGLEILDISNNDIGYLPPGLSRIQSLKELVVFGNRFRVPRPAVVEQGTKAILEFLKRRYQASNE